MKIAHLLMAGVIAGGAVLFGAAPASAALADVIVVPNGAPCPSGYGEIAQLDQTTICYDLNIPEYKIITNGAPCSDWWGDTGWTEYSVLNTVRVCLRFS